MQFFSIFFLIGLCSCVFGQKTTNVLDHSGHVIECLEDSVCKSHSQLATCMVQAKSHRPCKTGHCQCQKGYKWSRVNSDCIIAKQLSLGSTCLNLDDEIYPEFASCDKHVTCNSNFKRVQNKCQLDCPLNTKPDYSKQSCIPSGGNCKNSSECSHYLRMNGHCDSGFCKCQPGYAEAFDLDVDDTGYKIVARKIATCVKENFKTVGQAETCDDFPDVWRIDSSYVPLLCQANYTCSSCPEDTVNFLDFQILMNINRMGICRRVLDTHIISSLTEDHNSTVTSFQADNPTTFDPFYSSTISSSTAQPTTWTTTNKPVCGGSNSVTDSLPTAFDTDALSAQASPNSTNFTTAVAETLVQPTQTASTLTSKLFTERIYKLNQTVPSISTLTTELFNSTSTMNIHSRLLSTILPILNETNDQATGNFSTSTMIPFLNFENTTQFSNSSIFSVPLTTDLDLTINSNLSSLISTRPSNSTESLIEAFNVNLKPNINQSTDQTPSVLISKPNARFVSTPESNITNVSMLIPISISFPESSVSPQVPPTAISLLIPINITVSVLVENVKIYP